MYCFYRHRKKYLKSIERFRDHRQYTRSLEKKQAIHNNRYSTLFHEKQTFPILPGEREKYNITCLIRSTHFTHRRNIFASSSRWTSFINSFFCTENRQQYACLHRFKYIQ